MILPRRLMRRLKLAATAIAAIGAAALIPKRLLWELNEYDAYMNRARALGVPEGAAREILHEYKNGFGGSWSRANRLLIERATDE